MQKITLTNLDGETITLSNQAPYFLEKLEGAGEIAVAVESQKAPRQDGSTYIDNTLENRYLTLEGSIVTRGDGEAVKEARRKMQRVLNPKLGEVLVRYQDKEITALAESTPVFPGGQGSKGLYYQKFLLHLVCHQPFWLDPYYEGREMSYLMGGITFQLVLPTVFSRRGFQRLAVNTGHVATPVQIEFTGLALNPAVTNETTGEFIQVNQELGEEDLLTISTAFGEKYVRINEANAFHYIDLDSTFWQLLPGDNLLSYTSNNDSIKTQVVVKWKNRYIGL